MSEHTLKEKIVDAAFKLFISRGIKSVTMDMIAQQLGISKRTLYEEFSSKETLLKSVIDVMGDKMIDNAKSILSSDLPSIIKIFSITSLSAERSNSEKLFWHDIMITYRNLIGDYSVIFDKISKNMRLLIAKGIEEGYFYHNINIDTFIAMMDSQKIYIDTATTPNELLDIHRYSTVVFLRSISTPKGIDIIDKICLENNINIITGLRDEINEF